MSIDKIINNLAGYEENVMHFEGELRSLNRLADSVTEGVIVAVGSYRGKSDCALALHAHTPVYAIDPREPYHYVTHYFGDIDRKFWMENVLAMGLAEKIRPINLTSQEAASVWTQPIGLLFIDAVHDYEHVKADLEAWLPHVIPGGIVCMHDANLPAVLQAILERDDLVEFERCNLLACYKYEFNMEWIDYYGVRYWLRKGPYNVNDRYVLGEVRSYDLGDVQVNTFIDLGANIGAFAGWMKQLFPNARGLCVEPEPSSFRVLSRTVAGLDGVEAINGRTNYDPTPSLLFVDPVNSASHRIIHLDQNSVTYPAVEAAQAFTLEQLMEHQRWEKVDLVKTDCEGCEIETFLQCADDTLLRIQRIVGERHQPYEEFMAGIGARLQGLGFEVWSTQDPLAHSTFWAQNTRWIDAEPIDVTPLADTIAEWAAAPGAQMFKAVEPPQSDKPKRPVSRQKKGKKA